jgi:hypothetical protein
MFMERSWTFTADHRSHRYGVDEPRDHVAPHVSRVERSFVCPAAPSVPGGAFRIRNGGHRRW